MCLPIMKEGVEITNILCSHYLKFLFLWNWHYCVFLPHLSCHYNFIACLIAIACSSCNACLVVIGFPLLCICFLVRSVIVITHTQKKYAHTHIHMIVLLPNWALGQVHNESIYIDITYHNGKLRMYIQHQLPVCCNNSLDTWASDCCCIYRKLGIV